MLVLTISIIITNYYYYLLVIGLNSSSIQY